MYYSEALDLAQKEITKGSLLLTPSSAILPSFSKASLSIWLCMSWCSCIQHCCSVCYRAIEHSLKYFWLVGNISS